MTAKDLCNMNENSEEVVELAKLLKEHSLFVLRGGKDFKLSPEQIRNAYTLIHNQRYNVDYELPLARPPDSRENIRGASGPGCPESCILGFAEAPATLAIASFDIIACPNGVNL